MPRMKATIIVFAIAALGGSTMAFAGRASSERGAASQLGQGDGAATEHHGKRRHAASASARLVDAAGDRVGRVSMRQQRRDGVVHLRVRVRGLPPGFHGFHVHTTGRCDAPGFTTAGGHLNPAGAAHGTHAGDLPSLLVNEDGTGTLQTATDRFSIADLRDRDGSAVVVHAGPDNFANIPSRYGTPDQATLDSGDSGDRLACGLVRR